MMDRALVVAVLALAAAAVLCASPAAAQQYLRQVDKDGLEAIRVAWSGPLAAWGWDGACES